MNFYYDEMDISANLQDVIDEIENVYKIEIYEKNWINYFKFGFKK